MKKFFCSILICLTVAGCAGREAKQVDVVQDTDFTKSCEQLTLEAQTNDFQIKQLITQHAKRNAGNAASVVAGIIFLPALLAMDLKGADKTEYEALVRRNVYLSSVAKTKDCPAIRVRDIDEYKAEIAAEKKAKAKSN